MSEINVDGSIMLFHAGRCLECVLFLESTDQEYTEKDWMARYRRAYAADVSGKSEEEIMQENKDAGRFCTKPGIRSASSSVLANRDTSPIRFEVIAFDGETMDLKMELDEPASRSVIAHTLHVSMKLKFVEVSSPVGI